MLFGVIFGERPAPLTWGGAALVVPAILLLSIERGEWRGARRIWEALDRPDARDYYAAVELAKLHEHRLKDPAAALAVLHGLPEGLPRENLGENRREELEKRRGRLERKTANENLPR